MFDQIHVKNKNSNFKNINILYLFNNNI